MILAFLAAAAAASSPQLAVSRTLAVRAQVVAVCTASVQVVACRGAANAAPLSRRYERPRPQGGARLVIDY